MTESISIYLTQPVMMIVQLSFCKFEEVHPREISLLTN